jgi:hypothetical protein
MLQNRQSLTALVHLSHSIAGTQLIDGHGNTGKLVHGARFGSGRAMVMALAGTCAGERRCMDDELLNMGLHCQNYLMHPDDPMVAPWARCCDVVRQVDVVSCLCSFAWTSSTCRGRAWRSSSTLCKPGGKCGSN